MTKSTLRQLQTPDLDNVVLVHSAAFPGFLMTLLGTGFLRIYYQTSVDCPGAILLGKFDEFAKLQGFVVGFADPQAFYSRLARRKGKMLVAAAVHLLRRPRLWPRVLENAGATSQRASGCYSGAAELASIAVLPSAQGRGLGRDLIAAFLLAARERGANCVDLTTDADGNDAVNRLYASAGFNVVGISARKGGRRMNHYTISLTPETYTCTQGDA